MIDRWPFYGYCIFENEICNGHKDCQDGSDEENCDVSSHVFISHQCQIPQHLECARFEKFFWEYAERGVYIFLGICLGSFMTTRPTLGSSHWWKFGGNLLTQKYCYYDVIMTFHHSNEPALL